MRLRLKAQQANEQMNWRPQVDGSLYTRSTSWLVASVCPEFGLQFECSVLSLIVHQLSHPTAKRRAFLILVQSGSSSSRHVANLALPSPVGDVTPPKEKASVQSKIMGRMGYDRSMSTSSGGMGPEVGRQKAPGNSLPGPRRMVRSIKKGLGGRSLGYVASATYAGRALSGLVA
ncbi:hypothetical protein R1flu_000531 [Riccia fluitans]|uniref:Uncharacterized protein n=1 Tax=Riccia fluitans TaxID=41844 RepID=A0ABD1Y127_9MARC